MRSSRHTLGERPPGLAPARTRLAGIVCGGAPRLSYPRGGRPRSAYIYELIVDSGIHPYDPRT
jgi:hypothetical protein